MAVTEEPSEETPTTPVDAVTRGAITVDTGITDDAAGVAVRALADASGLFDEESLTVQTTRKDNDGNTVVDIEARNEVAYRIHEQYGDNGVPAFMGASDVFESISSPGIVNVRVLGTRFEDAFIWCQPTRMFVDPVERYEIPIEHPVALERGHVANDASCIELGVSLKSDTKRFTVSRFDRAADDDPADVTRFASLAAAMREAVNTAVDTGWILIAEASGVTGRQGDGEWMFRGANRL